MTNAQAPLRLWRGQTVHQRSTPFRHRFRYGLSLIDLDIDALDEANRQAWLFSVDRPNLFSFNRHDHGSKDGDSLRKWAEPIFAKAGIEIAASRLRLITFARHAFYKFAPISLWLAYDQKGAIQGVIYEVHNTFGETHLYVAATSESDQFHRHDAAKAFHVSPFFDVSGRYQFTLRQSEATLRLIVATYLDGCQTHVATIQVKEHKATSLSFIGLALSRPLSSLGVTLAIHWQALKLWVRGAKYRGKPGLPSAAVSVASKNSINAIRETAA